MLALSSFTSLGTGPITWYINLGGPVFQLPLRRVLSWVYEMASVIPTCCGTTYRLCRATSCSGCRRLPRRHPILQCNHPKTCEGACDWD